MDTSLNPVSVFVVVACLSGVLERQPIGTELQKLQGSFLDFYIKN